MKYVKQRPSTDLQLKEKLEREGWTQIKEPPNALATILCAMPLMFLLSGVVICVGYALSPELFGFLTADTLAIRINLDWKAILFIICVFGYMILHEFVHAACIPHAFQSEKTCWGMCGAYAFIDTQEPMTKGRYMLVSCMPFVMLSLVALPLAYACGLLHGYTFLLFLINGAGSCVDFLSMLLVCFQVKNNRKIINNGCETYYSPT